MRKTKISWLSRFSRLFAHKLKPYLVDEKYKVIPAFSIGGVDYWMFDSTNEVPTGRFYAAMDIYMEMEMNCDKPYLIDFCNSMEKILSPTNKKLDLTSIVLLVKYLKERVHDLHPFPDYVYKLASVIFFDKTEPLTAYDHDYNKLKIERWKAAGGTLDFFSKTPLKELVPSLNMPAHDIQTYSIAYETVKEIHQKLLTDILSAE